MPTDETPDLVEKPPLLVGSIETSSLIPARIDRWPFASDSGNRITINVASEIGLDVAISFFDLDGDLIAEQNDAQNGEPEILSSLALPSAGTYEIRIHSPGNASGQYAILVYDEGSYPFIFQGTLAYGDSQNAALDVESDHFWHFVGQSGDIVTVNVDQSDNSDLILRLYGPDGLSLIEYSNKSPAGIPERLLNYSLPDSGLYSVVVGEFNFGRAVYQITITKG